MPPFVPNVSGVSAITEVLPKDEYMLAVGEPKAFTRTWKDKQTGEDVTAIGVRYPVKVKEGNYVEKRQYAEFTLSQEAGIGAFKRFAMAALGIEPTADGESKFNTDYATAKWDIDPEHNVLADIYRVPTGKVVYCNLDVRAGENGAQFQKFGAWSRLNR